MKRSSGTSSSHPALWLRVLLVAVIVLAPIPLTSSPAHAAQDITDQLRGNQDITLSDDAVVNLGDGETITYNGVISGVGTLTVSGSGTLILTADSDFSIPEDRQRQRVEPRGEPWWWNTIVDPDPPAVSVEAGATLQYGDGEGSTGVIGHYPYDLPNFEWNALNHHVDGTFIVAVHGGRYHPGNLSGSGYIVQPRHTWDGLSLAGNHTFDGMLYNGTVVHYSQREFLSTMPGVDTVLNQGSFIIDTQEGNDTVLDVDYYSREWGNDINFHSQIFGSKVVVSGVYSWADSGPDHDPSLSDPDLNFQIVAHNHNKRGINIEGAKVQWGDGTHDRFFLPGNRDTVYINMHEKRNRSHLIFNYNGPVTLAAPISGGIYHDTMDAIGQGDVTIAGTSGNEVTFADQQNYNGATTIESGAVLRLGTGSAGSDGWLLTGDELTEIRNDGALTVNNAETDIDLSRISGEGSLEQAGAATLTLTGETSYTGPTVVSDGTLAITGGSIAASASLSLSGEGSAFDINGGGDQTATDLSGVEGSQISLGANTLTVNSANATEYAGTITGDGDLTKAGPETLTFTGTGTTPNGLWSVDEGTLKLSEAEIAADLTAESTLAVAAASTLTGDLSVGSEAVLDVSADGGGLTVDGDVALDGQLVVTPTDGEPLPAEIPVITTSGETDVSGTFADLAEGAELTVGDTVYRMSYEDGQAVLRTDAPDAAPAEAENGDSSSVEIGGGLPNWAILLGAVALALLLGFGLLLFLLLRHRRDEQPHDDTIEIPALTSSTP